MHVLHVIWSKSLVSIYPCRCENSTELLSLVSYSSAVRRRKLRRFTPRGSDRLGLAIGSVDFFALGVEVLHGLVCDSVTRSTNCIGV
jgi:hypothetical protein